MRRFDDSFIGPNRGADGVPSETPVTKQIKKYVIITSDFDAVHNWEDCPFEEVSFLRHPHRHIFKVKVTFKVTHSNRDVEFFMAQKHLKQAIVNMTYDFAHVDINTSRFVMKNISCEMMAEKLCGLLSHVGEIHSIEVWEDGENGAKIEIS